MNFGEALEMLEQGKRMARTGWNGRGLYIYLTKGRFIRAKDWTGPLDLIGKHSVDGVEERGVYILSHIDMKTANGDVCIGWLASQTDMLADDWMVIE